MGFQVHRVEHLVDPLALGPVEVPVGVTVRFLPASGGHHIIYSIGEGRPELDGRAAAGHLGSFALICFGGFASAGCATAFGEWQSGWRLVAVGSPARAKPVAVVQEL